MFGPGLQVASQHFAAASLRIYLALDTADEQYCLASRCCRIIRQPSLAMLASGPQSPLRRIRCLHQLWLVHTSAVAPVPCPSSVSLLSLCVTCLQGSPAGRLASRPMPANYPLLLDSCLQVSKLHPVRPLSRSAPLVDIRYTHPHRCLQQVCMYRRGRVWPTGLTIFFH